MAQTATRAILAIRALIASFGARTERHLSHLARRRRRLRGVVTIDLPSSRLTRTDRIALRFIGLTPAMRGASGEAGDGGDAGNRGGDRGGDGRPDAASAGENGTGDDDRDTFPRDHVERIRRESAGYRQRAHDAETKLRELEDRDKSEGQRAREQVESLTTERDEARTELWRYRAATKHGIPEDLIDLITGSSEDEFLERAEKLARRLGGDVPRPRRSVPRGPAGGDDKASSEEAVNAFIRGGRR